MYILSLTLLSRALFIIIMGSKCINVGQSFVLFLWGETPKNPQTNKPIAPRIYRRTVSHIQMREPIKKRTRKGKLHHGYGRQTT